MNVISVCIGSACHIKGSYNVINTLQELIEDNNFGDIVEIKAVFCLGKCSEAVSVKLNDDEVESVNSKSVKDFFRNRILPLAEKQ